ncbi:hypothetical protein QE152_g10327 [Popillia japonica]|uniref:Uncharacterized protein n=1 Tax=Popillia japonica TaxID=7064 RepID=A0AAW1LWS5_POPJA
MSIKKNVTVTSRRRDSVINRPKTSQNIKITKEEIQKNIKPQSLEVGIVGFKGTKSGGVVIECKSKEDSEKLKNAADKKIKKKYNIKVPELVNPSVKILDIEDSFTEKELEDYILKQNAFLKHEDLVLKIKISRKMKTKYMLKIKISRKMKTKYMAVMEVDPLTHTRILNEGKLSIGWSTCRVFDYIRVFRCFRCWGFDHRASEN